MSFITILLYIVKIPFIRVVRYKMILMGIMYYLHANLPVLKNALRCFVFYNWGVSVEWASAFTAVLYFIIVGEGVFHSDTLIAELDHSYVKSGGTVYTYTIHSLIIFIS